MLDAWNLLIRYAAGKFPGGTKRIALMILASSDDLRTRNLAGKFVGRKDSGLLAVAPFTRG